MTAVVLMVVILSPWSVMVMVVVVVDVEVGMNECGNLVDRWRGIEG